MRPGNTHQALFLDRDGVINVEKNYVYRIVDFEFLPGIFELCARASALGYLLVVVTNQAGIGRGYYTEADFLNLTEWMLAAFRERGIVIQRVYHCPYHPTAGIGEYRRDAPCRKPKPGMLLQARDDLGLDLARSVFIGDKDSDMAAGQAAGVGTLIKLEAFGSLDGPLSEQAQDTAGSRILRVDSLWSAAEWLATHCQ